MAAKIYRIDFDEPHSGIAVAPLKGELQRRQRAADRADRAEWAKVSRRRDRSRTYVPSELQFNFSCIRRVWQKAINTWAQPHFAEHQSRLERIRDDAMLIGATHQAEHAEHLRRQVMGKTDKPWEARRTSLGIVQTGVDDVIGTVLLRAYGPDPCPAFIQAMAAVGIIVTDPSKISAGNTLRRFHVLGDDEGTQHGWAILHRCPGAGTFGSLRTCAVHRWHSRPWTMEDAKGQFVDDLRRAMEELNPGTIPVPLMSKLGEKDSFLANEAA